MSPKAAPLPLPVSAGSLTAAARPLHSSFWLPPAVGFRQGHSISALFPLISSLFLPSVVFSQARVRESPQSRLYFNSLGQCALQATCKRVTWEVLGTHSGILVIYFWTPARQPIRPAR
jgi:hypothetical protein